MSLENLNNAEGIKLEKQGQGGGEKIEGAYAVEELKRILEAKITPDSESLREQMVSFVVEAALGNSKQRAVRERFGVNKFDLDNEVGLDKLEFENFCEATERGISDIIKLGDYGKFASVEEDIDSDVTFSLPKLAKKFTGGKSVTDFLIQDNTSMTAERSKQLLGAKWGDEHFWKGVTYAIAREAPQMVEDVFLLIADAVYLATVGVPDVVKYAYFRTRSNLNIGNKHEFQMKMDAMEEGHPVLGLLSLLGEKGGNVVQLLGSKIGSPSSWTAEGIAIAVTSIMGLVAGGAGAVKLGARLGGKAARAGSRFTKVAGAANKGRAAETVGSAGRVERAFNRVEKAAGAVQGVASKGDAIMSAPIIGAMKAPGAVARTVDHVAGIARTGAGQIAAKIQDAGRFVRAHHNQRGMISLPVPEFRRASRPSHSAQAAQRSPATPVRSVEVAPVARIPNELARYPMGAEVYIPRSGGKPPNMAIIDAYDPVEKTFSVHWSEGGKTARKVIDLQDLDALRMYPPGKTVLVPRNSGVPTEGRIFSFDPETKLFKVIWTEGDKSFTKPLTLGDLDHVNAPNQAGLRSVAEASASRIPNELARYPMGAEVYIPRSGGKPPNMAIIDAYDPVEKTFSVHWSEGGKTARKVVDLQDLDALRMYPPGKTVLVPRNGGIRTEGVIESFDDNTKLFKVVWVEGDKRLSKPLTLGDLDHINGPKPAPVRSVAVAPDVRLAENADDIGRVSRMEWHEVSRDREVMAVGDLHGSIDAYRANLKSLGVTDTRGNWIGGDRKVVFHGDILADRGTDSLHILEEISKLRKQARAKGGDVVVLAGNHEDFFISFLMNKKIAKGGDPFNISFQGGQGKGLLELRRFGSKSLAEMTGSDIETWMQLARERNEILVNMRKSREGRAILEEICEMKLVERVDDSLFVHTNPTPAMVGEILDLGIDAINNRYQDGLRMALLNGEVPPDGFTRISDMYLDTGNRTSFSDPAVARRLKDQGINHIFYGHNEEDFNRLEVGGVMLVPVDKGAHKAGTGTDKRSIAKIKKDGQVEVGVEQESLREPWQVRHAA